MSDEELILMLKERQEDGLSHLVDLYGNLIYRASNKILRNKELSEDSLNITLLKIWDNIESFSGEPEKFKNWIFTIAKYSAIDILRKEEKYLNKNTELVDNIVSSEGIEEKIIIHEDVKNVNKNLDELKPKEKQLIIDRYYNDESVNHIASKLGITPKATSLRINRVREKFRKILKKEV